MKIPDKKIKDDSGFYVPARRLVTSIREYYKREHGVQITDKNLEKEVIRIVKKQYE